ncbi:hypothetical protein ACVWZX_003779 [Deinococcus sp. UYEF24]
MKRAGKVSVFTDLSPPARDFCLLQRPYFRVLAQLMIAALVALAFSKVVA